MGWTITSTVDRKNWNKAGGWTYILGCQSQQPAYDDEVFCSRMQDAAVYTAVSGSALAHRELAGRDWNTENLEKDGKFDVKYGASWIEFRDLPASLYVNIVLGTTNELAFQGILDESLQSPNLFVEISLNIHFSAVEDNHSVPWPTKRRFLNGEAAFGIDEPTFSLVRRRI